LSTLLFMSDYRKLNLVSSSWQAALMYKLRAFEKGSWN